ncbi:MAG: ISKra4 family transposase, partial [Gemmatimonadetes bacterium]|nr:ISKra4 family transposase [Gemmatimonadota bacterium]
ETLARYTGAHLPQRQIEELVQRAAIDFDDFYETRRQEGEGPPPAEPESLMVITTDAKGVVMRKEDLRPGTRKAAERKGPKLTTRLSRGEKPGRKRMATVASVYAVGRHVRTPEQVIEALTRAAPKDRDRQPRPRPEHKRVWASLEKEPRAVLEEAFHEALDRDVDLQLTWLSIVDGNEQQLDILKALAKQYGVQLTIVLDVFHVLQYLWKAGLACAAEGSVELEEWVFERLGRILRGEASQVAAGMRRSATKRGLSREQRKGVDSCADYLLKYKGYLAYHQYLAAGMPIASGVIEGACRHLVKDRLALTGARWRLTGAEAVLRLRALRSSGDFDAYWRFHEAMEYERNHQARYADARVPAVTQRKKSRPKLVE